MSELVEVQLAPIFSTFRREVEGFRDDLLLDSARLLRQAQETSIRSRWYRTGATLGSLFEQVVHDGDDRSYQLWPTAVSTKGAPYPLFGEYGTGRRGAASGRPVPRGYRYGAVAGMTARRYSRLAVQAARPAIGELTQQRTRQFAANMTA